MKVVWVLPQGHARRYRVAKQGGGVGVWDRKSANKGVINGQT